MTHFNNYICMKNLYDELDEIFKEYVGVNENDKCDTCGHVETKIRGTLKNRKTQCYYSFPDLIRVNATHCSKCFKKPKPPKKRVCSIHVFNCKNCNKVSVAKTSRNKFCSRTCSAIDSNSKVKKIYRLNCIKCGKNFVNNRKSKHCSRKCRVKRNKPEITKKCNKCKKKFTTKKPNQIYCSAECSPHARKPTKIKEKKCNICMASFKTNLSLKKYCSKKCAIQSYVHKKNKEKNYTKIYVSNCKSCEKLFVSKSSLKEFCKKTCRPSHKEARSLRRRTKRNSKLEVESWRDIDKFKQNRPSEEYDLDHIIPLNHSQVCGLHNTWNFQWLRKEENNKKSNKFDGTNENESWRK